MTKHTVSARIALFFTVAVLAPFAAQTSGTNISRYRNVGLLNVGTYSAQSLMNMTINSPLD
ncbi:MAG: hypothetical protein LBG27_06545 [Spirochaetaceae bacterium]|jgi:hypothetical protein|nr:hypothetical protein [Spirochaetaceae bacterium]